MDEKIRIMVDAAILMENSFDGQQVSASDLLHLARLAGPLAREVERLNALAERRRLALLAEQGLGEGAPSDRWTWGIMDEEGGIGWKRRTAGGMLFAWGRGVALGSRGLPSAPHPGGWAEWTTNEDGDLDNEIARGIDALWNALDAMDAADAAHPTPAETGRH